MSAQAVTVPDPAAFADVANYLNTARLLAREINAALSEEGLREELWRILVALDETARYSMSEISVRLGLAPATTTRLIDELVDNGLVFRKPSEEDGRKALVYASSLGRARLSRANAILSSRSVQLRSLMSAAL